MQLTPVAKIPASPSLFTPGVASYGHSLPTPPVAADAGGVTAAMAGFKWRHPDDLPLSGQAVARAEAVKNVPLSTMTGATAASEIAEALLAGMNTFTAQMKETAKSQISPRTA